MKVLVTGGGGFLGNHIIDDLLHEDFEVISYSRKKYDFLIKKNVTSIKGDLKSFKDIQNASKNCHAIIHTAAYVEMFGDWKEFYETNIIGTRNVIQACIENNVKYLVYTSSPSVVFNKKDIINSDESLHYPKNISTFTLYQKVLLKKRSFFQTQQDLKLFL